MRPEFEKISIPIHSLNLSRLEGMFKAKTLLRRFINEKSFDLIHGQGIRGDGLATTLKLSIPHVASLRNYPSQDYPMKFGRLKGTLMARHHFKLIRAMKNPVACSHSLYQQLGNINPNLKYIQNGVNAEKFSPCSDEQKVSLRQELNLTKNKPILITVGSLIERKKPQLIVETFLKSDLADTWDLVILGDGPLMQYCREASQGRDNIHLLGQVANVNQYLKTSDLFISASISEGLPNTVLEALATGIPCILSDIPPPQRNFGEGY
jgi:glycosyltransferase involved in cell wall biosynthesis